MQCSVRTHAISHSSAAQHWTSARASITIAIADDPIQATQTGGNWRFQTSPIAVPSGWELWRSGEGAKSVFVSPLRRWTLPFRQGFARVELEVRRTQTISITMIPTTAEPANNP